MLLKLKNIGKVNNASIELNGISVIAGENDTGKSTISKILFCMFNSCYKIEQRIYEERRSAINNLFLKAYQDAINRPPIPASKNRFTKLVNNILRRQDELIQDKDMLQQTIKEALFKENERYAANISWEKLTDNIILYLTISDEEIFKTVLQRRLKQELNGQINNIYFPDENGEIELQINNTIVTAQIKENVVHKINNSISLDTEAIYIDDPFALDDINPYFMSLYYRNASSHREHLKRHLVKHESGDNSIKNALTEIVVSKKIDSIMAKLNDVCCGEMVPTKSRIYGYKRESSDAILDIRNVSAGLKTFVILRTLLSNGTLGENGTIILDEPEIHLHPKWQLILAELIVLIQKEFNMHILLNTHSPYFLNAIEVYAAEYEIADKCKYYLAERSGESKSIVIDVSTNIENIYKKLAQPFQALENERFDNE